MIIRSLIPVVVAMHVARYLDLSINQLTGGVPDCISALTALTFLHIGWSGDLLNNTFPTQVLMLSKLRYGRGGDSAALLLA